MAVCNSVFKASTFSKARDSAFPVSALSKSEVHFCYVAFFNSLFRASTFFIKYVSCLPISSFFKSEVFFVIQLFAIQFLGPQSSPKHVTVLSPSLLSSSLRCIFVMWFLLLVSSSLFYILFFIKQLTKLPQYRCQFVC